MSISRASPGSRTISSASFSDRDMRWVVWLLGGECDILGNNSLIRYSVLRVFDGQWIRVFSFSRDCIGTLALSHRLQD